MAVWFYAALDNSTEQTGFADVESPIISWIKFCDQETARII